MISMLEVRPTVKQDWSPPDIVRASRSEVSGSVPVLGNGFLMLVGAELIRRGWSLKWLDLRDNYRAAVAEVITEPLVEQARIVLGMGQGSLVGFVDSLEFTIAKIELSHPAKGGYVALHRSGLIVFSDGDSDIQSTVRDAVIAGWHKSTGVA